MNHPATFVCLSATFLTFQCDDVTYSQHYSTSTPPRHDTLFNKYRDFSSHIASLKQVALWICCYRPPLRKAAMIHPMKIGQLLSPTIFVEPIFSIQWKDEREELYTRID